MLNTTHDACRGRIDFRSPLIPDDGLAFSSFDQILTASSVTDIPACLEQLQQALADGFHAFCLISYEAAAGINQALQTRHSAGPLPLLWFGLSRTPAPEPRRDLDAHFAFGAWQAGWSFEEYAAAFAGVKQHIRDGDTYQLNLTFPLRADFSGSPAAAYAALCRSQDAQYCAFLQTPAWSVVSVSPELFVEWHEGTIHTRPMKGTRPRGLRTPEDMRLAEDLASNPKDRAENVMIVDLLRNDLGRIAIPGSVRVSELFQVEKYPTLWQMTSTVTATLATGIGLAEILSAVFPCGSVTGAPKVRTMALIAGTECAPRGIYCGAMGYLSPSGDGVFNVPIRTLTIHDHLAVYPVGSGVVADSETRTEYNECLLKARVLERNVRPSFKLLETMRWAPEKGFFLLERHLARLADSAGYFDFTCDLDRIRRELNTLAVWPDTQRVRLLLAADGSIQVEAIRLPADAPPFRQLRLASEPVHSGNLFLYHKTTHREVYAPAIAERADHTDVLLFNERGELTETTIANLALHLDGQWYTPPVACGLLAGTMREELCASGTLRERILYPEDLTRATAIHLFNSVRGRFPVTLQD